MGGNLGENQTSERICGWQTSRQEDKLRGPTDTTTNNLTLIYEKICMADWHKFYLCFNLILKILVNKTLVVRNRLFVLPSHLWESRDKANLF